VLTERADDMKFFDERIEKGLIARLTHVLGTPFRRLPYTEAIKILEKPPSPAARSSSSPSSGAPTCRASTSATSPKSTSSSR
jgi:aspartyl/asparaginyl-tRNA synthetase